MQLPTLVGAANQGLAGALPPSLEDLGPSLTMLVDACRPLDLYTYGIASVSTEIAALTGLQDPTLAFNDLTGSPPRSGSSTRRATATCPGTRYTTITHKQL